MEELQDLLQDIQTIPEVAALAGNKQRELALLLLNALGHYRAGEDLKGRWPFPWKRRPRGRTPQHHQAHFNDDCVKAWKQVTGDTVQVWYNEARDERSITMRIADAVLGGRGGWVGVSGLKKRARRACNARK